MEKEKEIKIKGEVENFKISSTGSLLEDINKIDIKIRKLPDIELKEVVIKETGNFLNLKDNIINIPIEMIVFPFFTPQKQNKRVNFQYSFEDLGVTMYCTLVSKDSTDQVFQPSIFEEKIYTYLISAYETKSDEGDENEYIEFEISDFIVKFLGNKMNRAYYSKVEQALKNLKNTEYQFVVSNHTKLGKYKFEDEEFKLLTYQKLKKGKKIFYRVKLNKNIRKKISEKRYIKYNSKTLMEILAKDPIAGRIYKYISKIRYTKQEDKINLRTLAAIIPLKTEQRTERLSKSGDSKTYVLCRMKQVLKRVEKAYDILVELGYVEYYKSYHEKQEDTYYIIYRFNAEKDGDCHVSSYLDNPKAKKSATISYKNKKEKISKKETLDIYENEFSDEEIEDAEIIETTEIAEIKTVENKMVEKKNISQKINEEKTKEKVYPDKVLEKIKKAKKNIYVSKTWDKRADNKIKTIYMSEGEEVLIEVLNILYKNLKSPIKTTLVQYINGILKNLLVQEKEDQRQNLTLFTNYSNNAKGTGFTSKRKINQARKTVKKALEIKEIIGEEKDIFKIFNEYDDYEKVKIEEKAIQLCVKEQKIAMDFILTMKRKFEAMYLNTIKKYIEIVITEEKQS